MWENRHRYTGISLLPFSEHIYKQSPFEEITKDKYEELYKLVKEVDLNQVKEDDDNTNRTEQLACIGGACEIP
jgi:ribonucleoside-diphosphate reductase alpha chain